jgi:hypothetical protein
MFIFCTPTSESTQDHNHVANDKIAKEEIPGQYGREKYLRTLVTNENYVPEKHNRK